MSILKYDKQVPRYTSYPTAPHFNSEVNSKTYLNWLHNLEANHQLSLYIHVPFCHEICWYCGCYTKATKRYEPIANYVEILLKEIELVSKNLKAKKVSHIHFGGGSPTILVRHTFEKIINLIKEKFQIEPNAEIAIEVDPRNIDESKVKTYSKLGINRVSIGVQDFNLEVQQAINRVQPFKIVKEAVDLFQKYQINNINFDLIYGLPKQAISMIENNIHQVVKLNPNRIALFAYAHVNWVKKHMRLIDEADLPGNEVRLKMYEIAAKKLKEQGYEAIGLDHFAKKDDEMFKMQKSKTLKRNFQGYSSDKATSIIGFGASAISYLPSGYAQNILDFNEYEKSILKENLPILKGIIFKKDDKIRKQIIDEIMCNLEVDLNRIIADFKLPENYFAVELENLKELEKDNLVKIKNNLITINSQTPQITRVVASIFDKYFNKEQKRHSKAI